MTLKLNGIELEFPDGTQVEVSEDGKHVKVTPKESEVVERIVFRDSDPIERIVIREVEVEKPCTKPHYHTYPNTYPNTYPWGGSTAGSDYQITWTGGTIR